MKKQFPGYFANGAKDLEQLWGECLFILDANVLLSLYRYSDSTRSDLLSVFTSLADRLWVPHQVAQEYLINRLAVIGDQVKTYDETVKKADVLKKLLENVNQHPFVSSQTLSECNNVFEKIVAELNASKKVHDSRISSDEIKDQLEVLLDERVGEGYSREELEAVLVKGKVRYDEKVPPGFRDAKKGGDSPLFFDRCKPYGDYIVWLQMIAKAKEIDKPVIFVTGDVKEDWWVEANGKTVGPQPQLINEFREQTGRAFYMYTPDKFLERASAFLHREPSKGSVEEIRDVREDEIVLSSASSKLWAFMHDRLLPYDRIISTQLSDFHLPTAVPREDLRYEDLLTERHALHLHTQELSAELSEVLNLRDTNRAVFDRMSRDSKRYPPRELEMILNEIKGAERSVLELRSKLVDLESRAYAVGLRISDIESRDN